MWGRIEGRSVGLVFRVDEPGRITVRTWYGDQIAGDMGGNATADNNRAFKVRLQNRQPGALIGTGQGADEPMR